MSEMQALSDEPAAGPGSAPGRQRFSVYLPLGIAVAVAGAAIGFEPFITIGLLGGITAFLFCASDNRMRFALFALAAYAPIEEFALKWAPSELFFPMRFGFFVFIGACVAFLFAFRLAVGRFKWVRTPIDTPLACFLFFSALSFVLNHADPRGAVISYQAFLRGILLVFYVVFYIQFTKRDARALLQLVVFIALAEAFIGVAQSVVGPSANVFLAPVGGEFGEYTVGRMTQYMYTSGFQVFATMGRYNVLASYLSFAILLTIPFFKHYPRQRGILAFFYLIAGACLALTAARGPWLGFAAGLWTLYAMRKDWRAFVLPLLGCLGVIYLFLMFQDQLQYIGTDNASPLQRVLELFTTKYVKVHTSNFGRLYFIFIFPFEVLRNNPLHFCFGFGPGMLGDRAIAILDVNVLSAFGMSNYEAPQVADVNWVYIFAQAGFFALLAALWMYWRVVRAAYRIYQRSDDLFLKCLAQGFLCALVQHLVSACFTAVLEIRPLALTMWLVAAVVLKLGYKHITKQQEAAP